MFAQLCVCELKRRVHAPRQETMQHAKAKKLINQHCVEKMTRDDTELHNIFQPDFQI